MLNQSKVINLNYAAQVVVLNHQVEHPNADNLIGWIVQGCRVWTNKDYKVGDICVYFPVGSRLSIELISYLSLYRKGEFNRDKNAKGFFEHPSTRVKPIKLRKEPSEGFLLKMEALAEFIKFKFEKNLEWEVGQVFDSFDDFKLCKKYVVKEPKIQGETKKKAKREQNLVENQFRLHYDTTKLALNEHNLLIPGDICVITDKWHGTSFVSAKVLVNRKLSLVEKVLKWLGVKIDDKVYDYVYSSRKVIKAVGTVENSNEHYYKEDLWKLAHEEIKPYLLDGMSVYGEIVGYTTEGSFIQKDYDYGCLPGQRKVLVYRITSTNTNGDVFEWDWASIKNWCLNSGILHVPELYYGPVKFTLAQLKEQYLEKDCGYCKFKVPAEGFCFRNESTNKKAYKCKSFAFLGREEVELEAGIVDIESQESEEQEIV